MQEKLTPMHQKNNVTSLIKVLSWSIRCHQTQHYGDENSRNNGGLAMQRQGAWTRIKAFYHKKATLTKLVCLSPTVIDSLSQHDLFTLNNYQLVSPMLLRYYCYSYLFCCSYCSFYSS